MGRDDGGGLALLVHASLVVYENCDEGFGVVCVIRAVGRCESLRQIIQLFEYMIEYALCGKVMQAPIYMYHPAFSFCTMNRSPS